MKRIITSIVLVAAVLLSVTSCLSEDKNDILVSFGSTNIDFNGMGLGDLNHFREDLKTVEDAFTAAFNASAFESMGGNYWVLRAQKNNSKAISMACAAGDRADAALTGMHPFGSDITIEITVDVPDGPSTVVASYTYTKL